MFAVDFSVGRGGQNVYLLQRLRQHLRRQFATEFLADFGEIEVRFADHESRNLQRASGVFKSGCGGIRYVVDLFQCRFQFGDFHTITANFHHIVAASIKFQIAILAPTPKIARAEYSMEVRIIVKRIDN